MENYSMYNKFLFTKVTNYNQNTDLNNRAIIDFEFIL